MAVGLEALDEVGSEEAAPAGDERRTGAGYRGVRLPQTALRWRSEVDRRPTRTPRRARRDARVVAFQLWISPSNPPGYHRDEAALSLNAYTLSTSLRDEDGARVPLFFRSFDDYKSPIYPYLLAGVFRISGPGQSVARGLSAVLVLAAILLLGVLARRLSRSWGVAAIVVVLAGFTPWLFELGRMAIEATTQPLFVVLLLLVLERAARLERYTIGAGGLAGVLIGLITYSYTGSRLLGPLFATALVVFAGRRRWRFVLAAWAAFAATLVPIGVYALRHPGNLTARYEATTIARDGRSGLALVVHAVGNWFRDINPWHWATAGDPAPYIHNGGYGALFGALVLLALAGFVLVLLKERRNLWWRYVVLATLLVPIPAAVTVDRYNAIRLATLPVFASCSPFRRSRRSSASCTRLAGAHGGGDPRPDGRRAVRTLHRHLPDARAGEARPVRCRREAAARRAARLG